MFDLRRLRALQALSEYGTVTAAADALHLTPSAISQQLGALGRELDMDLLERDGRRIRLTAGARLLVEHADALETQWERAKADLAAQADDVNGTLRVCGISSVLASVVAPTVPLLAERHPALRIHAREEESADCYRMLLAGETDLALVLPTTEDRPATDGRFQQQPLLDDPQDLLVSEGHRLACVDNIHLSDAAEESWIVTTHDNDTYTVLRAACLTAGFVPHITHEAKEWYAVSAMVAHGMGVCLLPRIVPIPVEYRVVRVPLHGPGAPFRRFIAAMRRGSADHPIIRTGLTAFQQTAANLL